MPVLIILGALWAAVLVPPLLRARADKKSGSIGDYAHSIGVLKPSNRSSATRSRPAAALVDGSMHNSSISKSSMIKKRRRDILLAMLGASGVTFLLALILGNMVFWALHLICDLAFGAYVYLLIQIKEQNRLRREGLKRQN